MQKIKNEISNDEMSKIDEKEENYREELAKIKKSYEEHLKV